MRNVLETVAKVVDRDVSVLILGESGSGKNYVAEAIHACSRRRDQPFVQVECAAIPEELFESELFGHERGTFTDAVTRKVGKLEAAGRGTAYFDEISALSPPLQAKLLRVLQERRFTRLGGSSIIPFEARVLCSSSADVAAMLGSGGLRSDFYYRINVVSVSLPALRDRPDDIEPLATVLLRKISRKLRGFDPSARRLLLSHSWPGNIRELRNAIERAAVIEEGDRITAASLPLTSADLVSTAARGRWTLEDLEREYIAQVLRDSRSNYSQAAKILGISRKTLLEKRRKYGLE
jgi:DNA-binding NtrC family response regulator